VKEKRALRSRETSDVKMPTFTYKARDNKGELKESSILADSVDNAKSLLKQEGLWVVDLKQIDEPKSEPIIPRAQASSDAPLPFATQEQTEGQEATKKKPTSAQGFFEQFQGVGLKDMVVFSRQFASMMEAGVAMLRALNVLTEQTSNKKLRMALEQIRYEIEQGGVLSDSMLKYPKIFDTLYVSMVRAGEAGGILDQVLSRLAFFMEERSRLNQQVKSAMTYPVVVMFIAVGVFYAMLTLVLPTFSGMFASLGSDLPAYTQMLINLSKFLRSWYMLLVIGIIVGVVWALKNYYQTKDGKFVIDLAILKMPIFGDMTRKVAVARFTRTFGTLIKSGVPIITSLEVVKDSAGNEVLRRAIEAVILKVQEGGTISAPLSQSNIFPPMVTQMVAIGEETGQLETMLEKVADFYDVEVETAVEGLTSLMEPLMIVILGGMVGAIVIGMYLPMFSIISKIQ